jgi:3-dehydroquinate dehydratase II
MTKKILIINGPNLNLLGDREESKYGSITLAEVRKICENCSKSIDIEIKFYQSNIEGEIVTMIQKAKGVFDGIIINAAGYTHTSVAILDALLAVKLPTIEVHITNIYNREDFREKSLISKAADGIICGFGINGYIMALNSMKEIINK